MRLNFDRFARLHLSLMQSDRSHVSPPLIILGPTEGTLILTKGSLNEIELEGMLTEGTVFVRVPTKGTLFVRLSTEGSPTEGSPTVLSCGTAFGGPAVTRGLVDCWGRWCSSK